MSITDSNSVLVIGAGTSLQFGMPDGTALFALIRDQIISELKIENRSYLGRNAVRIMFYKQYFDTFDFVPIILASIIKEGQYKEDKTQSYVRDLLSRKIFDAEQLVARLENQTSKQLMILYSKTQTWQKLLKYL